MKNILDLIELIKKENYVFIQTHNFPDHDAVASAFALQELFKRKSIDSRLIYDGEIERASLEKMISALNIDIKQSDKYNLTEESKIIVVDGCKGNKNVTDLIGDEIGVIDHHQVTSPEDVTFSDIRPDYGACSSIIFSYYMDLELEISKNVSTAMMIGINMDTALLTRGVSPADLDSYSALYTSADIQQVNSILRNQVQTADLNFYKYAIDRVKIYKSFAYCYFPEGCNQNLLGILGDFFLSLQEVDFVALCAKNEGRINFSLRSEIDEWNASKIIQEVLKDIGFGGGHVDMAGGIIKDTSLFDENRIFNHFMEILGIR